MNTKQKSKKNRGPIGQRGRTKEVDKLKLKYIGNCFKSEGEALHSKPQKLPSYRAREHKSRIQLPVF